MEKLQESQNFKTSVWSVDGRVGYQDYTFYNGTTLAKGDMKRTPWQLGGSLAWVDVGPNPSWAIVGQYQYQDTYTEQTSKTLCPSTSSTSVLKCVTGPIGAPTPTIKDLLTLEWRYQVGKQFAIDPSATYDAHSSAYSFGLPFYFVKGSSNAFTSGVRADWASDKHHLVVGVFVTKGFSVLGGASSS
jgi:hypothetical protein